MKKANAKIFKNVDLTKTLLAFDFDGTLSPIVLKPEWAGTSPALIPILEKLRKRGATIAVITGRSRKDVKPLLHFKPDFLIGNHGMEGLAEFRATAARARMVCKAWVKALEKNWPRDPGIFLEDKKESLSFHYREARKPAMAKKKLEDIIATMTPKPRVIPGKFLFNIIPQGLPHKGLALKQLMKNTGLRQAIFIGDDDTDEDVFRQKGAILSVRVGQNANSAAEFYIPRQTSMAKLLGLLTGTTHS